MKVEIFRRTVKDRRRGASWDLLQYMAEGVRACGDEPVIVNENMTGPWQKDEMEPTAPIGCMFGYGGTNQRHHTKGRRLDLVERAKKKGIYIITFDGGLLSSFGNVHGPGHHWRVSLYSPMNNGNFLSDDSPADRWEAAKTRWNVKSDAWRRSNQDDPIMFVLQPKDNWSMNELDPIEWFHSVYEKLRPITDRKFIVRPHPNHVVNIEERISEFPEDVEVHIGQKYFQGDEKKYYRFHFQEAITNLHAVVTHNSTAGVDSCVRGIPTFNTSDLAISWPVANKDLNNIETPQRPDRTQWLHDLGYKLWSEKEIRDGTEFKRYKTKLGL